MTNGMNGGDHADDSSEHHQRLPEVNEDSEEILRKLIHQQLDEIRTGNAYVEHELQPDCFSKLLVDKDVYSKFEVMTAKKWMDVDLMSNHESGLNGGKLNKKKKQYVSAIKYSSDFFRREIEQYTASHESPHDDGPHHVGGSNTRRTGEDDTVSSLSESKVSSSSHKRKKKSKKSKKKKMKEKKKSRKSKKRKLDHDSEESSDVDMSGTGSKSKSASLNDGGDTDKPHRTRRAKDRAKMKAKFEEERANVLAKIPENVKKEFRQVGFAKWGKDFLPVMFLGPYDVAPGSVRDQWFEMLEKIKKNRTPPSRLVFWYGTTEDDMSSAFSFINVKNTCTYEKGCSKRLDAVPERIQKKIDKGKKLSGTDTLIVDGLGQINKDFKLSVEERQPWLFEFEEEWEEDDDDDDLLSEGSEQEEEKVVVKKKRSKKKKENSDENPKQSKKKKENTDESPKQVTKKKTKRKRQSDDKSEGSKKKMSKHSKKIEDEIMEQEAQEKYSKKLDEEIMEQVAQETAFEQEEEPPSEDDRGDDDFSVEADAESEDDEDDALYEEDDSPKKIKPKKEKQISKRVEKGNKIKTPKSTKKERTIDPHQREQNRFNECERIFLPLMSKLNEDNLEIDYAEKYLNKILEEVNSLTAPFIKEHQIGLVIKDVRNRFKGTSKLNQLCKSITSSMKVVYKESNQSVPVGFEPKVKKRVSKKKQAKDVKVKKEEPKVAIVSPKRKEIDESTKESSSLKEFTVPKKGNSSVAAQQRNTQVPKVEKTKTPVREETKKFSLLGIMTKPKQPSTNDLERERDKGTTKENNRSIPNKRETKLPKWVTDYCPMSEKAFEANIDRELAMDFMNGAVACLPKEKIDPTSVATALEDALFTQYEGKADAYWDRVHDICSALAGKKKIGHLGQKIVNGEYASPLEVINIPKKMLYQSFQGHWIP